MAEMAEGSDQVRYMGARESSAMDGRGDMDKIRRDTLSILLARETEAIARCHELISDLTDRLGFVLAPDLISQDLDVAKRPTGPNPGQSTAESIVEEHLYALGDVAQRLGVIISRIQL